MIEEIKPVFTCDFCNKKLFRRDAMVRHEFGCTRNPKNFSACINCVHCESIDISLSHDDGGFDGYVQYSKKFKCNRFDKIMYPFRAVKKGLLTKYPSQFVGEEQMPTVCNGIQHRKYDDPYYND